MKKFEKLTIEAVGGGMRSLAIKKAPGRNEIPSEAWFHKKILLQILFKNIERNF